MGLTNQPRPGAGPGPAEPPGKRRQARRDGGSAEAVGTDLPPHRRSPRAGGRASGAAAPAHFQPSPLTGLSLRGARGACAKDIAPDTRRKCPFAGGERLERRRVGRGGAGLPRARMWAGWRLGLAAAAAWQGARAALAAACARLRSPTRAPAPRARARPHTPPRRAPPPRPLLPLPLPPTPHTPPPRPQLASRAARAAGTSLTLARGKRPHLRRGGGRGSLPPPRVPTASVSLSPPAP